MTTTAALPLPDLDITIVTDPADLQALADELRTAPLLAFDTETSSLEPHDAELIGLSFATTARRVSTRCPVAIVAAPSKSRKCLLTALAGPCRRAGPGGSFVRRAEVPGRPPGPSPTGHVPER